MISINYRDSRPIYEQIKGEFRRLILSGILPAGSRMPSVRELAAQLAINPNTIQRAYHELEAEGYSLSIAGKGSFVADPAQIELQHKDLLLTQFRQSASELMALGLQREDFMQILQSLDAGRTNHD